MDTLLLIIVLTWLAGFASFLGGISAWLFVKSKSKRRDEIMHGITAFGGGILISAVALALIPKGIRFLNSPSLALTFSGGGLSFCVLDSYLAKHGGSKAQLMAMLMDFIPESIALGALFVHEKKTGILLALFIGAQNLPEGFNSFLESTNSHLSIRKTLIGLFFISFLGPLAGITGYYFLQNSPQITAGIMSFAGGGILYLIFQDIAPQSSMKNHWIPPLGAVLGFLVGVLGKQLIG